jgi:hypothetical protein
MQLTYRGQSYTASTTAIEATPTGGLATFMGRPYARKQFNTEQRQQTAELTYRGIRYAR